jgi:hypothetical protein
MGEMRIAYKILVEKHEGSYYLADLDVNGKIILKLILNKQGEDLNWIHMA